MENFYGRFKLVREHNGIVDRFAEGQRRVYKESETFIIKSTEKTAEKPRK